MCWQTLVPGHDGSHTVMPMTLGERLRGPFTDLQTSGRSSSRHSAFARASCAEDHDRAATTSRAPEHGLDQDRNIGAITIKSCEVWHRISHGTAPIRRCILKRKANLLMGNQSNFDYFSE